MIALNEGEFKGIFGMKIRKKVFLQHGREDCFWKHSTKDPEKFFSAGLPGKSIPETSLQKKTGGFSYTCITPKPQRS